MNLRGFRGDEKKKSDFEEIFNISFCFVMEKNN